MESNYRTGSKTRLRLSVKPKKHHLKRKRQMHTPSERNKENETPNASTSAVRPIEAAEQNFSSDSDSDSLPNLSIEQCENEDIQNITTFPEGRRIFAQMNHHPFNCNFSHLKFLKEVRRGLLSTFVFECKVCNKQEKIETEIPNYYNANTAIVEGILCSGNGYSQMEEICGALNMPSMSKTLFNVQQSNIADCIERISIESMLEAGEEEKKLALQNNDVDDDGHPFITVVADGSWAKRSYKTSYSSLSGAACIIGYRTRKVLFIGIRNSYCSICERSKNFAAKNKLPLEVPNHRCFKNWHDSATAMEADAIAEGFRCSIEMHGLKYLKLIGDGDSSITNLLQAVIPYGPSVIIKKIECTNHLLRNYCNKLKALTKKTVNKKGKVPFLFRRKLENNILKLRAAVVGSVDHNNKLSLPEKDKVKNLINDIRNSPYRVFGRHENCLNYYCSKDKGDEDVVDDFKSCELWDEIYSCIKPLITNAESLILKITNNYAEQFNSIIAKFLGGKRVNYVMRRSYQTRCQAALVSYNASHELHGKIQKQMTNEDCKKYTNKYETKKKDQLNYNRQRNKEKDYKTPKKRKRTGPDANYGLGEREPDKNNDELEIAKIEFLNSLKKNQEERHTLERQTIGQASSSLWRHERRKRLTASSFGKICKMRATTPRSNTVKALLYSNFQGNTFTKYGIDNELQAIKEFENCTGLTVVPCGLFIDTEYEFLGASPDGLIVQEDAIIEIKCPYKAKEWTPKAAIEKKLITFCIINNDQINLKKKDNYYFQVQGQLRVTGRKYCYFVVWTPLGINFEKIERDDDFWKVNMKDKLQKFYLDNLLPELVDPRYPRQLSIRD